MKYTYEDVKNFFESKQCTLLSKECQDIKLPLEYVCVCGNVFVKSFINFRKSIFCSKCHARKQSERFRLSIDYVRQYFKENKCVLLETEYVNARIPLRYVCKCGRESKITFWRFKSGNRCKKCGNKKSSEKQTLSHDYVAQKFVEKGCILLSRYEKANKKLDYICKCGEKSVVTWGNFRKSGMCLQCSIKSRSGKNHYEWRSDRKALANELIFRQRCYKLVRMSLNATGRVKNKRTATLLGYDYKQLQEHILNHPNYEKIKNDKWHIDHIWPIKAFVDYGLYDLSLINCLENLRPLEAFENNSKSGKYCLADFEEWLTKKGIRFISKK